MLPKPLVVKELAFDVRKETRLFPLPTASERRCIPLWHPEDGALWVLDLEGGDPDEREQRAIWRVGEDGASSVILADAALGFPKKLKGARDHAVAFYFDSGRKQPVWLVASGEPGFEGALLLAAYDGEAFELVEQRNGIPTAQGDSFVFDPLRNVLVHFVAGAKGRNRGGLTARELGPDGTWQDASTPIDLGKRGTYAGWDARLKSAVVVDVTTRRSFAWDGSVWSELEKCPAGGIPGAILVSPQTKDLVLLERIFDPKDGYKTVLRELTRSGWSTSEIANLTGFGGGTYDAVRNVSYLYSPWFGPGAAPYTYAIYEGGRLTPKGIPYPDIEGGSIGGHLRFWGTSRFDGISYRDERHYERYKAQMMLSLRSDHTLASEPGAPLADRILADGSGCLAVKGGEVHRLEEGGWARVAASPSGFKEARLVGIDGAGSLLACGGPATWSFDGAAWSKVKAKCPPIRGDAAIAHDRARNVWVVRGGRMLDESTAQTHEWNGEAWTSFDSRLIGVPKGDRSARQATSLFAWDAVSKQLFFVSEAGGNDALFVYRGEGAWLCVASWDSRDGVGALAFDTNRRVIHALFCFSCSQSDSASVAQLAITSSEIAIGALLDEVASSRPVTLPISAAAQSKKSEVRSPTDRMKKAGAELSSRVASVPRTAIEPLRVRSLGGSELPERDHLPAPDATLGVREHGATRLAVSHAGEVRRFENGQWTSVAKAPSDFVRRETSSIGIDGTGRLLLVGGETVRGSKRLTDAWLFDRKAWRKLPPMSTPKTVGAAIAFDPTRDAWIMKGGRGPKDASDPKTYECDGEAWRALGSSFVGRPHATNDEGPTEVVLLELDDESRQVFLVTSEAGQDELFVYQGTGNWIFAGSWTAFDEVSRYDVHRRVLIGVAASGPVEVAIGEPLDAARRAIDAAVTQQEEERQRATLAKAAQTPAKPLRAFEMELVEHGEDAFGGVAPGMSAEEWPRCAECKHPMLHLLTLYAHPKRLPLEAHAAISLFMCHNDPVCPLTWDPDGGCNAAVLVSKAQVERKSLDAMPLGPDRDEPALCMKAAEIRYTPYTERPDADEDGEDDGEDEVRSSSKVGGYPFWQHEPDPPSCDVCKETMRFVAQLDNRMDGQMNFSGDGTGYLFCCRSEHGAKFLWQG